MLEPGELAEGRVGAEHPVGQEVGQQARGELPELELADVDAVEPVELLEVEDRTDRVDLAPVEARENSSKVKTSRSLSSSWAGG